jgi:DNA-binding YbaB/EbfC family protein
MSMDMNKMLQQVQQMQEQMAKAQEELAQETVEASVGGGMVVVKANGAGEIIEIKISPEAIDPDDPRARRRQPGAAKRPRADAVKAWRRNGRPQRPGPSRALGGLDETSAVPPEARRSPRPGDERRSVNPS